MNPTVRSLVSAIVAACLIGGSISSANAADPRLIPQSFTISGSGWGHGLGMSQYGARGMALEKKLYPEILEHYFNGSKVKPFKVESNLDLTGVTSDFKVGLGEDKKFIFLRGEDNPLESGTGGILTLTTANPTNTFVIAKNVDMTFGISPATTISIKAAGIPANTTVGSVIISWDNAKTLANLESSAVEANQSKYLGNPCETAATSKDKKDHCSHRYKYGTLEIAIGAFGKDEKVVDTTVDLNVVNNLRLADQYIYGISEMSSSWPTEALKTQVVASRSFAYAKYLDAKKRSDCLCTVVSTDGDQVFAGFIKEISPSGAQWKAAVDGTITVSGADLLIDNANAAKPVIAAYFSSSSGGKTQ